MCIRDRLGQAVAYEAMDTCMKLADKFGVGIVSVDNATHYLWGGGYVMDAALKGYFDRGDGPRASDETRRQTASARCRRGCQRQSDDRSEQSRRVAAVRRTQR